MLTAGPVGAASEVLILPNSPITVECVPNMPDAHILGTEPAFSIYSPKDVKVGTGVAVRSTDIRIAKFEFQAGGNTVALASAPAHNVGATEEEVIVTMPSTPNLWIQLLMKTPLYGDQVGTPVKGWVKTVP